MEIFNFPKKKTTIKTNISKIQVGLDKNSKGQRWLLRLFYHMAGYLS